MIFFFFFAFFCGGHGDDHKWHAWSVKRQLRSKGTRYIDAIFSFSKLFIGGCLMATTALLFIPFFLNNLQWQYRPTLYLFIYFFPFFFFLVAIIKLPLYLFLVYFIFFFFFTFKGSVWPPLYLFYFLFFSFYFLRYRRYLLRYVLTATVEDFSGDSLSRHNRIFLVVITMTDSVTVTVGQSCCRDL